MKSAALIFATTLIASPAFAAADLCTVNLQKLDDEMVTNTTLGEPLKSQVEELKAKAMSAQQAGKSEECATAANQALMLLDNTDKGGSAGS